MDAVTSGISDHFRIKVFLIAHELEGLGRKAKE